MEMLSCLSEPVECPTPTTIWEMPQLLERLAVFLSSERDAPPVPTGCVHLKRLTHLDQTNAGAVMQLPAVGALRRQ